MIVSVMDLNSEKEILEIGCGTGEIAFFISKDTGAKVLATDLCVPFIDEAKLKFQSVDNLSFECLDFTSLETLRGRKFDYIVGNGILHHLYSNLDETLNSILYLLKEDGKLIFLEPNVYNPYCWLIFKINVFRKLANLEPDEMAFSKSFIKRKLQRNNFQSIKISFRDFLLPITPSFLINFVIRLSDLLEKIPFLNVFSQSIFIVAQKKSIR
jgi:SAM-dependent methyltransferase